jgi:hypothetical protein
MTSRYKVCKDTLLCNITYAKNKNINIVIILFDTSSRVYTNSIISTETKEILKLLPEEQSCELHDSLSYDKIMEYIINSEPMGGTDFLIPFVLFDKIKEFNKGDIFFLSDGYNTSPLQGSDIEFLSTFKSRITTLGVGNKHNFDSTNLSKMSKDNLVIEGMNSDIIQQELLAQMSDSSTVEQYPWKNVTIVLCGHEDTLKCGTMMHAQRISEDHYNSINYVSNTDTKNLVFERYGSNNFLIKKKEIILDVNSNSTSDTLYFVVDQSGSMNDDIHHNEHNTPSYSVEADTPQEIDDSLPYVKYTYTVSDMKYYHRVIFNSSEAYKGYISWTDHENNTKVIALDNSISIDNTNLDENMNKILSVTNTLGHYINISNVCDNSQKIGNFRNINKICEENKELFANVKNIDFSLIELLFFNKKQGMKLYNSTLSPGERNMQFLLAGASSSGGGRALSAAATMNSVSGNTPSQQYYDQEANNNHHDMTLCTICYSEIRQYVFSCGHCYSCKDCAEKILISEPKNKCCYCKKDITWIRKITMNDDQKDTKHYFKCISDDCYNIATIVSECIPMNSDDSGYHLTYCKKCYNSMVSKYKKMKKSKNCFCGEEIKKIKDSIFFN